MSERFSTEFNEQPDDRFESTMSFHMLRIAAYPHRAVEYTEKLISDPSSCKHTVRVGTQLLDRLKKFLPTGSQGEVKHLEFAANYMWRMNFSDLWARMAGMFLQMMIAAHHGESASPEFPPSTS